MIALIAALLAAPHPCVTDAQKVCPDARPGNGSILQCLKAHPEAASPACQQNLSTLEQEKDACEADLKKLCPNETQPGPGRRQCMRAHYAEVSPDCKALLSRMREGRENAREAIASCRPDVQKFCAGVEKGGGRIIECLKTHQSELSPACSSAMGAGH
jgi:hypothetical protein